MRPSAFLYVFLIATSAVVLAVPDAVPEKKHAPREVSPQLMSLVEAERAFAKLGSARGVREFFMAYFAEDGILFRPHPVVAIPDFKSRPAPATPPPVRLEWTPMYADIAKSGDFGYTLGPSVFSDLSEEKRPPRYGYFFSVWKKQANGEWKVALDCGIQSPDVFDPANPPEFRAAPASGWQGNGKPADGAAEIEKAEKGFAVDSQWHGTSSAFSKYLDVNARFHRNDMSPVLGKEGITKFLRDKKFAIRWEAMKSDIAKSGDLGYTYGKYWAAGAARDGNEETGYYVHMWRKDSQGKWKVVLHATNPAEFEKK